MKIKLLLVCALMTICSTPGIARNPLKTRPSDPTNPGGGLGGSQSNTYTLGAYQTNCMGTGKVLIDQRQVTINGHKQMVAHLQVSGRQIGNSASANVLRGSSTTLNFYAQNQNAILFQLVGEDAKEAIQVNVTVVVNQVAITLPFTYPSNGNSQGFINLGHNNFAIPVGGNSSSIPRGALVNSIQFTNIGGANSCKDYITEINNVHVNGVAAGIATSGTQICGSDCN